MKPVTKHPTNAQRDAYRYVRPRARELADLFHNLVRRSRKIGLELLDV